MSDNVIMSFGDISTIEANVSGAAYMGKGDKGDPGSPGVGISSIVLNADYTLTINLDDGTSYTTPPIRGEQGERGEQSIPGIDGQTGDVVIVVPDKTSQLTNDSGFLTEHQSLAGYATEAYVDAHHDSTKQDAISDLATIRSGAALGATAVQPVAGKDLFSGNYNDLTNKPTIPDAVTESTVSGWGFTKNTGTYVKPSDGIPASDIASNAVSTLYTATIPANGWTAFGGKYYNQIVTVQGILSTDNPVVDVNMAQVSGADGKEAANEAWGTIFYANASANAIQFYANDIPTIDIPIKILCIRK